MTRVGESEAGETRSNGTLPDCSANQTSGLTSRLILAYAERAGGSVKVDEILARCDMGERREDLRDGSLWFGFDTKVELFAAAAEVLDDPQVARHIGGAAVELNVLTLLSLALRAVGSPQLVYAALPRHARKFTSAHRLELIRSTDSHASFRYVDVSGVGYHRLDCEYTQGMLASVPTMFGAPPARIRHSQCAVEGADACVYEIWWEDPRSQLGKTANRWLAASATAFLGAAPWGRRGLRIALGVPALGGALVATQGERRRRQRIRSLEAEVRDQQELGARVFASLRDLVSELRVEEVLAKVVENAQAAITGREFALMVLGDDSVHCRSSSRVPVSSLGALECWATENSALLDSPLALDDLESVPGLATLRAHAVTPLGAMYSVPLRFRSTNFGALVALAHGGDSFDPLEVAVLSAYADQAAIALANAHLFTRVEELARRDPLTGLLNSREFDADLTRECLRAERYGRTVAVIMLDLDGFKQVNDRLGHAEGDRVLRLVGQTLDASVETAGRAYRTGGDEFALVLPHIGSSEIEDLVRRLKGHISMLEVGVDASCGVAVWPQDGPSQQMLVFNADRSLYAAKARLHKERRAPPPLGPPSESALSHAIDDAGSQSRRMVTTALARAVDARDAYTSSHSEMVSQLCEAIARELGLTENHVSNLALAGLLHDVGKVGVPDAILLKPGPLTEQEFGVMKTHPTVGYNILAGADLGEPASWILHHHEQPDGRGYPAGLAGDEVPLESRIILVADAFEALTSDRPYRRGCSVADALAELDRHVGTQFDRACVEALRKIIGTGARDIFLAKAVATLRDGGGRSSAIGSLPLSAIS